MTSTVSHLPRPQFPTPQEVFDRTVDHLASQGRPSRTAKGACHYRSPMGRLKCALGYWIPDELYDQRMEGIRLLDSDDETYAFVKEDPACCDRDKRLHAALSTVLNLNRDMKLLQALQEAHDNAPVDSGGEWASQRTLDFMHYTPRKRSLASRLIDIAATHELDASRVPERIP